MRQMRPGGRSIVYGPVPSRRLGFSLGVDILPFKTCTLDCVYCQLGPTPRTTARRADFTPVSLVLAQVKKALRSGRRIDFITLSGSGEPTLHSSIEKIIRGIKKMTSIPVAVLTNGTLFHRQDVRRDLLAADLVVPSLDAATTRLFARINRPHRSLRLDRMIKGLADFRKEFKGRIWLEIMLVKGINDSPGHIRKIKNALSAISPDRIHLNTVVRPPAEKFARALGRKELEEIRRILGEDCEVVADFPKKIQPPAVKSLEETVLSMARRRPVTSEDIAASLGREPRQVRKVLAGLLGEQRIRRVIFGRKTYFEPES